MAPRTIGIAIDGPVKPGIPTRHCGMRVDQADRKGRIRAGARPPASPGGDVSLRLRATEGQAMLDAGRGFRWMDFPK